MINKLDRDDTMFIVLSILIPLTLWWATKGRKKYSVKGMT